MKLKCLNLWLGEMCTDDDANTNDANDNDPNDDDARRTKYDCIRLYG